MALSSNEAVFVKCMILQGNKLWAIRNAYPRLEKGFEEAGIRHMYQNPEVQRHIDAGVLYMFRDIVKHTEVPIPAPLSTEDKIDMLELVIKGEREHPAYIATKDGLKIIFVEPDEEEVAEAKRMLRQLKTEALDDLV